MNQILLGSLIRNQTIPLKIFTLRSRLAVAGRRLEYRGPWSPESAVCHLYVCLLFCVITTSIFSDVENFGT